MCTSYSFLDASTEEYQEEEVYFQEEEDHFDQYTNQGKLYYCKMLPMQANTLAKFPCARLYKSKAPLHFTLCLMVLSQVFTLQALLILIYQSLFLIHDSLGLVME